MLRESTPCLKAVHVAPDSLYLQSPPMLVRTCYCVVSIMPWNFPVATGLKPTLWHSYWRLYAFCWASAIPHLWNQPAELLSNVISIVFWWFPTCVTYKTALLCEGRLEKPNTSSAAAICQFLRICVFSWADPINEGPCLSQHPEGQTQDAWCICQDQRSTFIL